MGKISKRDAESFKWRIERLIESKRLNTALDLDMASWLDGLDGQLRDRLVKVGLIASRERRHMTLGELLDEYMARRQDVKKATAINWGHTRRNLLAFFGADRPIESIAPAEASDFERWLRCGNARENRYAD